MQRRTWLVAITILVVISGAVVTIVMAQSPKETKAAASPFTGKVLVVSLQSESNFGAVLGEAKIKQLGSQSFLVGKGLDYGHPDDWRMDQTIWIALSSISSMTEFADLETYEEAVENISRRTRF